MAAILVIEDDSLLRTIYEALLSHWGHAAQCVPSTRDAIAALDDGFMPDAIISDYHLGGGDTGLTAIRAVFTKLGRRVPAIFVTSEDRIVSDDLPVFHKPLRPLELAPAVTDMLCPPIITRRMANA